MLHTTHEAANLIPYKNISESPQKRITLKWGNPLFRGQTDFTIGFTAAIFPIHYTTSAELCDYRKWVIFAKYRILADIFGVLTPLFPRYMIL